MIRKTFTAIVLGLAACLLVACSSPTVEAAPTTGDVALPEESAGDNPVTTTSAAGEDGDTQVPRPEGWGEETHDKSADPNYDVVFPQDQVNRIDITIAPKDWQTMWDDMTELYGEFGANPGGQRPAGAERPAQGAGALPQGEGMPAGPGVPPQGEGVPAGPGMPPQGADEQAGQVVRPGGGLPMGGLDTDQNPVWVPATIEFEGNSWTNAGIRFKGNSSLQRTWGSGTMKLPFKLDFDEFEDDTPEIEDQRFYGFKQLTLASNFGDDSLLKEKATADVFRDAGVPSAHTAFYRVYVDYGEGPVYFGLYTMVEVVDDTVIQDQFEDDSGNVYKPDGTGASFADGTFSEASFDKETNQDEADWSDVLALFDALHADQRTTDPAAWRGELESVFDVDGFLKWLAVNTVVQNWDTYGTMSHNYYLYNDPTTGLLTWIPWDNNEALKVSMGGHRGAMALDLSSASDSWPLISYLRDDELYYARYVSYVQETINGAFEPSKMAELYQELHDLIQPYVTGDAGEIAGYTFLTSDAAFDAALEALIDHVYSRYDAAQAFLEN